MRLVIDTRRKRFIVTRCPEAKVDQHKEQRIDKPTGLPMWSTQIVVIDDDGGETIAVTTVGECPDVQVEDDVKVVNLVAIPWNTSGRSGIAFRADRIEIDP